MLAALRRAAYRSGFLSRERLPVPVVVVGNITVGGSGKTPLVIHLALALREQGRRPGIVSRGYRGDGEEVTEVTSASDPAKCGDEPVLLAMRSGCPVFVGRRRAAAARALLAAHPECDMLIADDGLQHYALERDFEIAVFDRRGVMNGWCLPAGPLREPVSRLARVGALVLNECAVSPAPVRGPRVFLMRLQGDRFCRLDDSETQCDAAELEGKRLHAVAGIGAPQRFFDRLRELGLGFVEHPFADHHRYCAADLAFSGDAILTTEKDAVKLSHLSLSVPVWVLPVTAHVEPDLAGYLLETLHGFPTA